MTTKDIMDIALDLAKIDKVPEDSEIHIPCDDVKSVLIGVDMETAELLVGKELGVDLVISHHPKGDNARINFPMVMDRQIDKMVEFGVPINRAQKALAKRKEEVDMNCHVANYDRFTSAARALNIPYMNIHMPADIIGEDFVQNHLDKFTKDNKKATLQDIVNRLNELPVYKNALASPVIRVGSPSSYAGKIAVLFAGGTNGGVEVYKSYFEAGVGTIICMHVPPAVKEAVQKQNIGNIIVTGHMASDSVGLNKIIEAIEEKGVKVHKMSGIL